jgi:hypothetical protein
LAIRGMLLLLVTVVAIMTSGIANATPTAERTLPAEPVPAGECFLVKIEVYDYGTWGQVIETLPEGFKYRRSTLGTGQVEPEQKGDISGQTKTNKWKFPLWGETSFIYTVIAHDSEGTYTFSGILKDMNRNEYKVVGDMEIEIEEAEEEREPSATRTLPEEPVAAGECFTIEIEASHYGYFGNIVETLPEGFVYEDSTLNSESIEVEDDTAEFSLEGEPSFSYTMTAPDTEGTYTFSGILIDEDKDEYDIGGDTEIVVGEKGGEVTLLTNITAWKPIAAVVNSAVGELRAFNISVNQPADISWQINGTEVQTNESVTDAVYTNTRTGVGTWNVSAIATSTTTGLSDIHTWIWRVTATPAVNITSTPTPTSAVALTPLLTPTPKSKLSPRPTSIATPTPAKSAKPALPGFELVFALAAIFAVAYLRLHRKKRRQ